MKELNQIVTTKLTAMIEDGSIEKMIESRLESLMEETIDSAMESYSDFGKSLTETIERSIGISLKEVSFPEYNHFVAQLVQEKYGQALASTLLEKLLKDELSPVPEELSANDILDEIKECWEEAAQNEGKYEIEIEWEKRNSAIDMHIIHPEFSFQSIRITFYNHGETDGKYHIGYINEDNKLISGSVTGATYAIGLAGYFYKLYCRQTKITDLQDVFGDNIDVCDY